MDKEKISEQMIEQITRNVVNALREVPGQTYLGHDAVKHRIVQPISEGELRKKMRANIARKFHEKWKC